MSEKITIMDTTLRDGEQSAGASMNMAEKLQVATQLEKLGVDIMEVGFPIASDGEFESVAKIASRIKNAEVMGLARCNKKDIDACWGALKNAAKPRLHVFISTSELHMKYKLKMTADEVLKATVEAVTYGATLFESMQFGLEDGTRSDRDFVCKLIEAAIDAGVGTINFADTVGYILPFEFTELIKYIMSHTPNIHKAVMGVHCHNDLGMATANTLAAVDAGARHVEVTVNGIGERAGNTSLEEVVMAIQTRPSALHASTGINLDQIYPASRLVTLMTGMSVQPNKAVVGANAFAHESGIHQHGVLANPLTYEIMKPETIGLTASKISLGKLSGKHGLTSRLEDLGYKLDDKETALVFTKFKTLADLKKNIVDDDLHMLVAEALTSGNDTYTLHEFQSIAGDSGQPIAKVTLGVKKKIVEGIGSGNSPINAAFNILTELSGTQAEVINFSVNALSDGSDAQAEGTVRLSLEDQIALGRAVDTDIIRACAKAFVNGLNRLEYLKSNPILHTGEK